LGIASDPRPVPFRPPNAVGDRKNRDVASKGGGLRNGGAESSALSPFQPRGASRSASRENAIPSVPLRGSSPQAPKNAGISAPEGPLDGAFLHRSRPNHEYFCTAGEHRMVDDPIANVEIARRNVEPGVIIDMGPGVGASDRALNHTLPLIRPGAATRHRAFPRPN